MCKIRNIDDKFYIEDKGELLEITDKGHFDKKTNMIWYKLPENSSNRKLIQEKYMIDGQELKYRETRILGTRTTTSKSLTEYMTEDDLRLYNEIIKRAEKAREEARQKAQSPEEKLRRDIARLQARLEQLKSEE